MTPLQRLDESLAELLLYQAKEGGREGGLLVGLCPHPRADPICLLQEEENLVPGGVNTVVSHKHCAKDDPNLDLGRYLVPACDGGKLLLSH